MPPWMRGAFAWIVGQVPTVLTLAGLVGLAWWGAANDWKLPHLSSAGKEKEGTRETVEVVLDDPGSTGSSAAHSLAARQIKFPSSDAVDRAGVEVKPVEVRTIARYVMANSSIDYEPGRYARLMARASGTVWRLEKEAGDSVKKGEVVALIDAAEVGKAKADFLQSLAQVRLRTATLEQLRSLDESAAMSQRAVRDADTALREARIRLFNDQQALLNLGLRFQLKDVEKMSENELARYMRLLGVPERVRKEFDPETLTANLLPVASPLEGVVVQRLAALGDLQQITQPKPIYMVANTDQLHFEIDVNPEDIAEVHKEQVVEFRTEGATEYVASGAISHIVPEIDEKTRKVRVHAEFDNRGKRLRPNTFGTVRILTGKRTNATVVPREAVQSDGNAYFVLVQESKTTFRPRVVKLGLRDGDRQEVVGVRAGDQVVTKGSFMLKSELLKDRIAGGDE